MTSIPETFRDAEFLKVAQSGAVLTITLDDEAKRNAIGAASLKTLMKIADAAEADSGVRALIITGAGDRAFTSGFNLKELTSGPAPKPSFGDVMERLAALPMPVIGALNGHCMGGGVHLAMACDMRIAAPGVRMMIPASRFGFVYTPAAIRRIRQVLGQARAAQILYLGEELALEDLAITGFAEIAPDIAAVMDRANEVAERAAALAPLAVAGAKEIVREDPDEARETALADRCLASADYQEGMAAIREKRTPVFSGS